jgi:hypothetical protein
MGVRMSALRGMSLLCVLLWAGCSGSDPAAGNQQDPGALKAPFQLPGSLQLTRWGDADRIEVDEGWTETLRNGDSDGTCIRVSSRPGESGWAAVYWQSAKETGVRPPLKLEGARRVRFWVRGEAGGEKLHVHLAGSAASELLQAGEVIELGSEWREVELQLDESKQDPVTGVFGIRWIQAGDENPEGLTFYLDDIRFE